MRPMRPRKEMAAMAEAGDPAPEGVTLDTSLAHPARVYDYWLGGKDNFAADREAAEQVIAANPNVLHGVRANRAFLDRAVRYLAAEAGIRQFLDLGTGLPTAQNTHQVAQEIAPDSRIVYVDNDPIVLAYAEAPLTSAPEGPTAYVLSDIRDTEKVLAGAAETLELSRPVGHGADGPAVHPGRGRPLGDRRPRARVAPGGQLPDRLRHGPRHRHRAGDRGDRTAQPADGPDAADPADPARL
jgi:hypothetical protein